MLLRFATTGNQKGGGQGKDQDPEGDIHGRKAGFGSPLYQRAVVFRILAFCQKAMRDPLLHEEISFARFRVR